MGGGGEVGEDEFFEYFGCVAEQAYRAPVFALRGVFTVFWEGDDVGIFPHLRDDRGLEGEVVDVSKVVNGFGSEVFEV